MGSLGSLFATARSRVFWAAHIGFTGGTSGLLFGRDRQGTVPPDSPANLPWIPSSPIETGLCRTNSREPLRWMSPATTHGYIGVLYQELMSFMYELVIMLRIRYGPGLGT